MSGAVCVVIINALMCKCSHRLLQVQLIESLVSDLDLKNKLWEREKYWQCQLFTNTHGMNSVSDFDASKRKG